MPTLEKLCDDVITSEEVDSDFRLWLSSYPSQSFPVSVLQRGVKMTDEAPRSLRANLNRQIKNFGEDGNPAYYKLLFSLSFFHAVLLERQNYGVLGWNLPYEFSDADLHICQQELQAMTADNKEPNLDVLTYTTGECNYGGKITDPRDKTLLLSFLHNFCNKQVIKEKKYKLTSLDEYYVPEKNKIKEYMSSLPLNLQPEVLGLHQNAKIFKDRTDTRQILKGLLSVQPQGNVVESDEDTAVFYQTTYQTATELLQRLPPQFDLDEAKKRFPTSYEDSLNSVLVQELHHYNKLTKIMKETLAEVQKCIKGDVQPSQETEKLFKDLQEDRVPKVWARLAYPFQDTLADFVADLKDRLDFFSRWLSEGHPRSFWMPAFFSTRSLLTAVLQNHARQVKVAYDTLTFTYDLTIYTSLSELPEDPDGIYIHGLYLQGADWDGEQKCLVEAKPNKLCCPLPLIQLVPTEIESMSTDGLYSCPVYHTCTRGGILSKNLVMELMLNCGTVHTEDHWRRRGVAAICQPD